MLARFLHSGKFWLKLIIFGGFSMLLLVLGLYTALYQMFDAAKIQTLLNESIEGSGRSARFDAQIGRSWFPRPTVTLRNLTLSKPHSSATALHIDEMKIGLAWRNLFGGGTLIEKWVVNRADVELFRDAEGRWSLQDLWAARGRPLQVNRLIINDSRLNLYLPTHSYRFSKLSLNSRDLQAPDKPFTFGGSAESSRRGSIAWQSSGTLNLENHTWAVPDLHIEAEAERWETSAKLTADADLSWQPDARNLRVANLRISADSPEHNLHLSAQSPLITRQNELTQINELSSVFTAGTAQTGQWDGTFSLNKISLRPTVATLAEFSLNGSHKIGAVQTSFTASGPLQWQQAQGWKISALNLSTLQDNPATTPRQRFVSQLQGALTLSANRRQWQTSLQGLFDRQPAAIEAAYSADAAPAKLSGSLKLARLNLAPYFNMAAPAGIRYPELLQQAATPEIETQIQIGSLTLPGGLQADDFTTRMFANRERIALTALSAGLYGGRTEGGISMANTSPPAYHLQQAADNVLIRPLLQDLLGYHNISGTGNAVIDITARGDNRKSLTQTLAGSLQLNVADGAMIGFDMRNILSRASDNAAIGGYSTDVQTPFSRFSMSSDISGGISRHDNTELVSDTLLISSSGSIDFNTQMLSESLLIRNARNRSAKPVPLKITGPAENPSVTLDYPRLTLGLNTPEEKRRALAETLKEQWQWLKQSRTLSDGLKHTP